MISWSRISAIALIRLMEEVIPSTWLIFSISSLWDSQLPEGFLDCPAVDLHGEAIGNGSQAFRWSFWVAPSWRVRSSSKVPMRRMMAKSKRTWAISVWYKQKALRNITFPPYLLFSTRLRRLNSKTTSEASATSLLWVTTMTHFGVPWPVSLKWQWCHQLSVHLSFLSAHLLRWQVLLKRAHAQ